MIAGMAVAPTMFEVAHPADEQRMLLRSVSWKEYVLLRDLFDGPGLRMTYSGGCLELMTLSAEHELWKKNIARLVELFAYIRGIDLRGYGSTTFKSVVQERGAEPDECYLVGKRLATVPEIVVEVIRTAPLLNKLDVYRALGVPEVWVFRSGAFIADVLDPRTGEYTACRSSALVPSLDLAMVARHATREDTTQALRDFEAEVRAASR
jgi:Uma2 family endonuclease